MATTNDHRYGARLELELRQADERIQQNEDTIKQLNELVRTLQAQVADLKPLAEAAQEHRQRSASEQKRADEAEDGLRRAEIRLDAAAQTITTLEEKVSSLERDLVPYEKLDQKVKAAGNLFDLLDG